MIYIYTALAQVVPGSSFCQHPWVVGCLRVLKWKFTKQSSKHHFGNTSHHKKDKAPESGICQFLPWCLVKALVSGWEGLGIGRVIYILIHM
jgi:hypothetical protein